MIKGYWVAHVDVNDEDAYKDYIKANAEAFAKYGARFVVRGGKATVVEGTARRRHVVIEFDSYQQAVDCYNSSQYTRAAAFRKHAAISDLVIIEGYDGRQPGD